MIEISLDMQFFHQSSENKFEHSKCISKADRMATQKLPHPTNTCQNWGIHQCWKEGRSQSCNHHTSGKGCHAGKKPLLCLFWGWLSSHSSLLLVCRTITHGSSKESARNDYLLTIYCISVTQSWLWHNVTPRRTLRLNQNHRINARRLRFRKLQIPMRSSWKGPCYESGLF